ncbi:hypothetical protein DFJ58DRAFT_845393 [Suillus subalutaceus]|uniref:uncharacterized protein n=1 Tax=Suillus subalutaceus TaxID=48586 RepID=UPI001B86A53E|nr:uncharacterized protein DFJ58DRAFT_845393 [Suillus subalutaceus]KAG1840264.1 hypothetical protein DFJ58DRAFT_845393 [Suillus subalutaceus]
MDTMVSIWLDGLISMLQGLCLDDRTAISVVLQAGTSPNVAKGPVANLTGPLAHSDDSISAPDDFPAIIAAHSPTSTTVAPAPALGPAYYNGTYFNVPIEVKSPLYYIMRGCYIGVFSGWDATGPKVLGVLHAIYRKANSLEHGVWIVKHTIEHGGFGHSNTRCFIHQSKSFGSNKCSGSLLDAPCVMVQPSSRIDKSKTYYFGPNKFNDPLDDEDEPMLCGFDLHVSIETLQDYIATVKYAKDDFMAHIKAPQRFFDLLMDKYSKTMPDPNLYPTRANSGLDGILKMCGICDEWRAADAICKFMREMVGMVEDILLHLAEGRDSELVVAFMGVMVQWDNYFWEYLPHLWLKQLGISYDTTNSKRNYNNFWPPFFERWEENLPITLEDSSEPLDENMRLEQIAKARDALQTHSMVKLHNDFGNLKIGHQPAVKKELNAMKNALDAPEPKSSVEVKEEVTKLAQEMKEKREKEKEVIRDKNELPKELLTEILSTFFTELYDSTGWMFSVLLAGPDPMNAGKLNVNSLHIGTTIAGNQFNQAYPTFEESIMVPYFEFASRAFLLLSKGTTMPDQNDTSLPDTQVRVTLPAHNSLTHSAMDITTDTSLATVSSASTSTPNILLMLSEQSPLHSELSGTLLGQFAYNFFQFSPPYLQDDDIDLDFNRFSPLTSTSRTTHDISSRNVADFSFAAPHNNASAPMATPTPAHTPTPVEIPTSVQPSTVVPEPLTTEPIMATPSPPATVGEVLPVTMKASKRKSMKSNTHLKTVSTKHQKREGAVVLSTESSQPIEGGRVSKPEWDTEASNAPKSEEC